MESYTTIITTNSLNKILQNNQLVIKKQKRIDTVVNWSERKITGRYCKKYKLYSTQTKRKSRRTILNNNEMMMVVTQKLSTLPLKRVK